MVQINNKFRLHGGIRVCRLNHGKLYRLIPYLHGSIEPAINPQINHDESRGLGYL